MHKIVSATRSPACAALVALASAAVILITVVLAASAQATAPAAAADPGQVRILRFIDRVDESANTDIDLGATGPSAGDQQVFRDILLRNGRRIGTASGVAQVVARDATTLTAQVVSTQTLPGGLNDTRKLTPKRR